MPETTVVIPAAFVLRVQAPEDDACGEVLDRFVEELETMFLSYGLSGAIGDARVVDATLRLRSDLYEVEAEGERVEPNLVVQGSAV